MIWHTVFFQRWGRNPACRKSTHVEVKLVLLAGSIALLPREPRLQMQHTSKCSATIDVQNLHTRTRTHAHAHIWYTRIIVSQQERVFPSAPRSRPHHQQEAGESVFPSLAAAPRSRGGPTLAAAHVASQPNPADLMLATPRSQPHAHRSPNGDERLLFDPLDRRNKH